MGVGPPRIGLRPGVGQEPGYNPEFSYGGVRRVIHFPDIDADHYPGRNLYTYIPGYVIWPLADLTPDDGLQLRGNIVTTVISTMRGIGRLSISGAVSSIRDRVTTLSGLGALLSHFGLPSSAPAPILSVDVPLATHSEYADLSDAVLDGELADVIVTVEL